MGGDAQSARDQGPEVIPPGFCLYLFHSQRCREVLPTGDHTVSSAKGQGFLTLGEATLGSLQLFPAGCGGSRLSSQHGC